MVGSRLGQQIDALCSRITNHKPRFTCEAEGSRVTNHNSRVTPALPARLSLALSERPAAGSEAAFLRLPGRTDLRRTSHPSDRSNRERVRIPTPFQDWDRRATEARRF